MPEFDEVGACEVQLYGRDVVIAFMYYLLTQSMARMWDVERHNMANMGFSRGEDNA